MASAYTLLLTTGGGPTRHPTSPSTPSRRRVVSARVEEGTTSHTFPDLELGVLYTVEVTCEVAGVSLACGEVTVATRPPDLVARCPPSPQPPAAGCTTSSG